MRLINTYWKVSSFLLMVVVFVVFFRYTDLAQTVLRGNVKEVAITLESKPFYALILTLVIMTVQNSFTIIPLILVITLNCYLFGFMYGFLWSWFSSIIAAILVFYMVRYWFQAFVLKKAKKHKDMLEKVENKGMWYVLYGRIFPFFPTSILNIIAGISTISVVPFTVGTAIGNFIYFFLLALIPFGVFSSKLPPVPLLFLIIIITVVCFTIKKQNQHHFSKGKKKRKRA